MVVVGYRRGHVGCGRRRAARCRHRRYGRIDHNHRHLPGNDRQRDPNRRRGANRGGSHHHAVQSGHHSRRSHPAVPGQRGLQRRNHHCGHEHRELDLFRRHHRVCFQRRRWPLRRRTWLGDWRGRRHRDHHRDLSGADRDGQSFRAQPCPHRSAGDPHHGVDPSQRNPAVRGAGHF